MQRVWCIIGYICEMFCHTQWCYVCVLPPPSQTNPVMAHVPEDSDAPSFRRKLITVVLGISSGAPLNVSGKLHEKDLRQLTLGSCSIQINIFPFHNLSLNSFSLISNRHFVKVSLQLYLNNWLFHSSLVCKTGPTNILAIRNTNRCNNALYISSAYQAVNCLHLLLLTV